MIRTLETVTKELVASIDFDVNGVLLPTGWQGGHGGLVSTKTLQLADECRRLLSKAEKDKQR